MFNCPFMVSLSREPLVNPSISSSGPKKIPQQGWRKLRKFTFSQFWRLEVPDEGPAEWVSAEHAPSGF